MLRVSARSAVLLQHHLWQAELTFIHIVISVVVWLELLTNRPASERRRRRWICSQSLMHLSARIRAMPRCTSNLRQSPRMPPPPPRTPAVSLRLSTARLRASTTFSQQLVLTDSADLPLKTAHPVDTDSVTTRYAEIPRTVVESDSASLVAKLCGTRDHLS